MQIDKLGKTQLAVLLLSSLVARVLELQELA